MNETDQDQPTVPRRSGVSTRRLVAIGGAIVGAAMVAGAIVFWPSAETGDASAGGAHEHSAGIPSEESAPPESAHRHPVRDKTVAGAKRALHEFLKASDETLRATDGTLHGAASVAGAAAHDELAGTLREFTDNGWRQRGAVTVVHQRATSTELDADPPTVRLRACLDSTDVEIVDKSGKPASPPAVDGPQRIPHLYTVTFARTGWQVTKHAFPREASC